MKKYIFPFLLIALMVATFFTPVALIGLAAFPFASGMNVSDMRAFANQNFSNYDGFEAYTGDDDDYVDFGGPNKNFLTSEKRIFVMTIANANASTRTAYIIPGLGYVPGRIASINQDGSTKVITVNYPHGIPRDAAFPDVDGGAGLSGSGSPKSIELFFTFIKNNPVHCHQIKIQSSAESTQIAQQLEVQAQSPFKTLASEVLNPDQYLDQNSYQEKKVTFPVDLVLSGDLTIKYPIMGSNTVTISFFCDALVNPAMTLTTKVAKAKTTLTSLGSDPFVTRTKPPMILADRADQKRFK